MAREVQRVKLSEMGVAFLLLHSYSGRRADECTLPSCPECNEWRETWWELYWTLGREHQQVLLEMVDEVDGDRSTLL